MPRHDGMAVRGLLRMTPDGDRIRESHVNKTVLSGLRKEWVWAETKLRGELSRRGNPPLFMLELSAQPSLACLLPPAPRQRPLCHFPPPSSRNSNPNRSAA